MIEKANVDWEIDAPIENLERLKNQISTLGELKSEDTIKNIDNALIRKTKEPRLKKKKSRQKIQVKR